MKFFRFLLISLGVLLILASLLIIVSRWNTDNSTTFCDSAARSLKEFEAAVNNYETAKAGGKLNYELAEYLKKIESAKASAESSTILCCSEQSIKKTWRTRKILLGVLGAVMLSLGLLIGRKKAA